jgi:hypothetical protein
LNAPVSAVIGASGKAGGRGGLIARKDEQRRMARRARRWRAHSDLTQAVNSIEGKECCARMELQR